MGVTIDSLQIEIQSSSANAAEGINALAKSLGELKKNGAFKTVTNNLNRLSDSLNKFPNVHKAANALRTLSNSIEQLKNVGSVSGIATSLEKLPKALAGLEKIDFDRTAPLIDKVVQTLGKLSTVKAGGLSSIVNGLSKLKEVSEKLDDDTIAEFGKKIDALNAKLGPLSEKMTSIKAGFQAINSGAKKAADGVEELAEEVNVTTFNLSNMFNVIGTIATALQELIVRFANITEAAIEWDGIAARFGRGFGPRAQENYEWIQRLNEELGINIQEFMKYSSVYSTMLTGFGVASEDAGKMALGYMELTYDIWAGYNDVYKSLEEAAEAVKSAIAGEVEPVRRAGFTIVEATLAQTAANHGLEISLANATEAQKSYLRYLTLMDQAYAQGLVGTYAKELNTAEGMMRAFAQQLKSLTQAFGSLFLPILVKVMPWLQAFVELLTEGVHWLAALFGVEIQQVDFSGYEAGAGAIDNVANSATGATDALDSATKAAKALKNATLGIDELNVISPNTASSDAGGGGAGGSGSGAGGGFSGLDIDSLWDETIFDAIQSDVDNIKEKLRGWMPVIGTVAAALAGLRLAALIKDLDLIAKSAKGFKKLTNTVKGISEFFKAAQALAPEVGWLSALFPKISGGLASMSTAITGFATAVGALVGGGVVAGFALIAAAVIAVGSAVYFLYENWEKVKQAVKDFFADNIAPKLEEITKHFDKMKVALGPLYTDVLQPIVEWVKSIDFSVVGTAFEWLGGIVVGIVGGVIAGAFNGLMSLVEGVVQAFSGLIQAGRGLVDFFIGIFTLDGQKISDGWNKIWTGIFEAVKGGYDATIGVVVEFVEGVIDWFVEMWDILVGHSIVPDTIDAIVEWFVSLPGKVLGSVGTFVQNVVDKFLSLGKSLTDAFSSAWEAVKTWWSQKPALSSYVPSIGDIKAKLSAAWTAAKDWWDKTKEALKSYTPSIGSIKDKIISAWTAAKDWWNKNRSSLGYTPTIGSIKDKIVSAWTSAKDWWNKNRSSLSYTPSIGSIKTKLSTAWTSAKDWWNKNRSSLSYTPSIGSIKDKIVSAWNTAKSWWNNNASLSTKLNVSVPKITVKWDTASAFGKEFRYPTGFSLKFAADGGIFDQGSLIWAGERGPEIMATAAGGKTGVMNVQQMQEAVYEGVFAAMTAAMRGNNSGGSQQVFKVYLDGKEITSTVERHQSERGASLMGNEVYAY